MSERDLLLLFDRPLEPIFTHRGRQTAVFDVPKNFVVDNYKDIGRELVYHYAESASTTIRVNPLPIVPQLGEILDLDRTCIFSLFTLKHCKIAGQLVDIFLGAETTHDLLSIAAYCHDRVNPYLFIYALSVAILHRPDTQDLSIPPLICSFPDKFLENKVLVGICEETSVVPTNIRRCLDVPKNFTSTNVDEEHRLAYFREDFGVNSHHWHWHLVYPHHGNERDVDKDRRGELFYYMHQQIIARYNVERLSNRMNRVAPFKNWNEPINEGYYPKLFSSNSSMVYPFRVVDQKIKDLNRKREGVQQDIDDLYKWRYRISSAIIKGYVTDKDGKRIELSERNGIDILGNIVESSRLSPNGEFYGDIHNMGHMFISSTHDPDYRYLENVGVMADTATAMRDPVFYRWHAYIDDLFHQHKNLLPRYTVEQLDFPGVVVTEIDIQLQGDQRRKDQPTVFNTYWQRSKIDVGGGLNFQKPGVMVVCFTHLQHTAFTYHIIVKNTSGTNRKGTCRIFIAPKFDETDEPFKFVDQKNLFIELDRFVVPLRVGKNVIRRNSTESSVTIPYLKSLESSQNGHKPEPNYYCECGWPHHMLVPKGNAEGFHCQLFVMISNYEDDKIDQTDGGNSCKDASSYCGLKDKRYPDRRAMGYPFDRLPRANVDSLDKFMTTNMRVRDCIIKFEDRVAPIEEKQFGPLGAVHE